MDLINEKNVINLMKTSTNGSQWNANCKKVKAANDGIYPVFWYKAIISSGIMGNIVNGWRS